MLHGEDHLTTSDVDDDANLATGLCPAQAIVEQELERQLQPSAIAKNGLESGRDLGADAYSDLLAFRDQRGKHTGNQVRRPYPIAPQDERASIQVRNLLETLECIARLLCGATGGAKHLFLILVQVAEVILEQNVEWQTNLIEALQRVARR
jgi:hypothetical protein